VNEEQGEEDTAQLIQRAVDNSDAMQLAVLLSSTGLVDNEPVEEQAPLYLRLLRTLSEAKRRSCSTDGEEDKEVTLSMVDIGEAVQRSRELATEAEEVCLVVSALNNLRDSAAFVDSLTSPYLTLPDLSRTQFQIVTKRLEEQIRGIKTELLSENRAWVFHRLEQGIPVYLNVKTQHISWEKPRGYVESGLIGIASFEDLVASIVDESSVEPIVTRFQAHARGFLVREKLALRLHHFHNNVDAVVKIQVRYCISVLNIFNYALLLIHDCLPLGLVATSSSTSTILAMATTSTRGARKAA